jgi:ERCC4-type nuclease
MVADRNTPAVPLAFPGVILVDRREQLPFAFNGLTADAKDKNRPIAVTTRVETLATGDYSLDGFTGQIAVERKSLADVFSTLGRGRQRFQRELERLNNLDVAAIVVEADWNTLINHPPAHTRMSSKCVYRSILAWQQRYVRLHWWLCPTRRFAEITCFRILERFWRDRN